MCCVSETACNTAVICDDQTYIFIRHWAHFLCLFGLKRDKKSMKSYKNETRMTRDNNRKKQEESQKLKQTNAFEFGETVSFV